MDTLTPQQARLVALIHAGKSWRESSRLLEVSPSTVTRWMSLPNVQQELERLRQAQQLALQRTIAEAEEHMLQCLRSVILKCAAALPAGADQVIAILHDPESCPFARLRAFSLLVEVSGLRNIELPKQDRWDQMPLGELRTEVERLLAEHKRTG